MINKKTIMISKEKFAILHNQKKMLESHFDEPVFIDIKTEKLYIILPSWKREYVF